MKANIDWGLCEGNGVCTLEAPDLFEMDDDDNLVVLMEEIPEDQRAALAAAAQVCPKRAITTED